MKKVILGLTLIIGLGSCEKETPEGYVNCSYHGHIHKIEGSSCAIANPQYWQQQTKLKEIETNKGPNSTTVYQCRGIAKSTGERCRNKITGKYYCHHHN
jgi:hypothetical protein